MNDSIFTLLRVHCAVRLLCWGFNILPNGKPKDQLANTIRRWLYDEIEEIK